MKTLLIEIGAEEIPAGYIQPALDAMAGLLTKRLADARVSHGAARTFGTPRRLAVEVADVAETQASLSEEVVGPPEKVGFDADGKPTMAARKFAEKLGVGMDAVFVKETPKGRYLCANRHEAGGDTVDLLAGMLPAVIVAVPFPKTMKWADMQLYFARPIRYALALFGQDVVPFTLERIESGRTVLGHRFTHPGAIEIKSPADYVEALRAAGVMADMAERRDLVAAEVARVAGEAGGRAIDDPELLDIVTNLVEFPAVVAGRFDTAYLELPDEVLITAMREHQKYFAVIDNAGKLLPAFIAVNNTPARDPDLVARGHERVLRARLADARFFYNSDLAVTAEQRLEKLHGVLFQARLGSIHEKVARVSEVAEYIAGAVGGDDALKANAVRAARHCKTDLVSQVVVEFPRLQGIMGRVYATVAGEPAEVAAAIEEHYRPTYSGGPLPETAVGAVVAIADKIDSICGCFSVGLTPTGASDPYALRRQGIGIIQIMLEKGFAFSLRDLIDTSAALFKAQDPEATGDAVYAFLQGRMVNMLTDAGYSRDVVMAVTAVSVENVPDVWNRAKALEALKAEPVFEPLAVAFKRVVNIIRKAEYGVAGDPDTALFEHPSEGALLKAFLSIREKVAEDLQTGRFDQAVKDIAAIRPAVDAFFDDVMVMVEDDRVRDNRLMLLTLVSTLFQDFADFSKITT